MAGFTTKVVAAAYLYEKMARKEKEKTFQCSSSQLPERLERRFRNPLY
jgi:hypothetical protein